MDLMINKTLTGARLFTTVAIVWVTAGCSGDDTTMTAPGGSAGSTTGNMNAGGARDSGRDMGGGGAGGSSPVDAGGAGGARDSGGDMSIGGGGGSGGSPLDALVEVGPPQAGTTVLLIDNVFVVQKSLGDAALGTDAAEGGSADGGDLSDGAAATGVSYTFDSDLQGWHYTPYGSTPNIGFADPGTSPRLKLSDPSVSQLEFDSTNDAEGRVDASGAMKLTVGFYAANDQIDVQAFSANPNDATQWKVWRGFVATAKVKFVSGGNLDPACPLRMAIYISTGTGYATVLSPRVNMRAGSDWTTLTFDFDTIAPGETGLDLTQVNQFGIQANTGNCTADSGSAEAESGSPDSGPGLD